MNFRLSENDLGVNKMTTTEKFSFYFIISQPILDMMTSIMTILQMPITVGAIVRTLLIVCLLIFISYYLLINKYHDYLFLWVCSFITVGTTFIINFFMKQPFFIFAELNFSLKTIYFICCLFFILIIVKEKVRVNRVISASTPIVALIVSISFWIAFITKTNVSSYTYDKTGYSGWFFSANELSVIILILLSLTLIHLHENRKHMPLLHLIAMTSLLSLLPMIGTKTAFASGAIVIITYSCYLLLSRTKRIINTHFKYSFLAIVLLFFISTPITPIFSNATLHSGTEDNATETKLHDEQTVIHPFVNRLLSSRDIYLQQTVKQFYGLSFKRQLFGLGYGGNYVEEPKLVEMDFFDLLFSYGYGGFFLLMMPFIIVIQQSFTFASFIPPFIKQLAILLILGIAFLAGHVLFAPSVMTYFCLLLMKDNHLHKEQLGEL